MIQLALRFIQLRLRLLHRWHGEGRTIVAVLHDLDLVAREFPSTLLLALDGAHTEKLRAEKGAELEPNEIRGMDAEEILNQFYGQVVFARSPKGWSRPFDPEAFRGIKLNEELIDAQTGEVVAEKDAKLTPRTAGTLP